MSVLALVAVLVLVQLPSSGETPSPLPSATSAGALAGSLSAEPLKEIGRVHAMTAFCSDAIDHAVVAVTSDVDNDAQISNVVTTLRVRATDLDTSEISKAKMMRALEALYSRLTKQAIVAERAAKALRTDAKKAPTPEQAKNLGAFADALDGALHRQRTIARDIATMLAYFDVRPQMTPQDRDDMLIDARLSRPYPGTENIPTAEDTSPPLLSVAARDDANNFVYRQSGIAADERFAAGLLEPAFGDC